MKNTKPGEPRLEPTYPLQQVAAHFNVTDQTIRRWIKLEMISARRVGPRRYCFTQQDIEAASRSAR